MDFGFGLLAKFCVISFFVMWPLGLWKMVEIIIWICKYVKVSF